MKAHQLNRWLGLALVLIASAWSWAVLTTVPMAAVPGEVGPRGFPLLLGVVLGLLGLCMLVPTLLPHRSQQEVAGERVTAPITRHEARVVGSVVALLVGYAFLLDKVGFLVATPIAVAAALWLIAGERSWLKVLLVAAGLTLGCYVVFGLVMKANLPPGSWL